MLQIEIFKDYIEDDLVKQVNYFLKQIDELLVSDIKYSSFAFFDGEKYIPMYSVMVVYVVK